MCSVSWDKSFKIWDLTGRYRCLESVKAHEDAINAVAVSDDGTVYTASADGCIKAWKRDEEEKRHALVSAVVGKQRPTVNALALDCDGDGTVLFSGGSDGTICRWERRYKCGGENDVVLVETLRGHGGAILCLANVAGLLLASGSADLTVRIWRRERGSGYCCGAVLEGHEKPVKSLVAISGGGGGDCDCDCECEDDDDSKGVVVTLFSGSLDGDIKVWEVFG